MENLINSLAKLNIKQPLEVIYNPSYEILLAEESKENLTGYEKATTTNLGAAAVDTGIFTGRSPKDKYIVKDDTTKDTIWWSTEGKNDNHPLTKEAWDYLKEISTRQLSNKKLFVVDAMCGANADTAIKVRFITEIAWQAHFVTNMFIKLTKEQENLPIDFTVINAARVTNDKWQEFGLNSENFAAFNLTEKVQLIGGTWYGGEMKKGMFSVMNYLLPLQGIASMHCAANVCDNNNVNLFFGLSGTGKTTLSSDLNHQLIGDDEHGWDGDGVFNFEGGCYAKVINLNKDLEPCIYGAIKPNALLENVVLKNNNEVDFNDNSKTENTRVSYPLTHIENRVQPVSKAGHAKNIIFLTADAFGVLPPVALLQNEQIEYYFLSGFTAKLAGTERGITAPKPTFSACFGNAFLTLHPTTYSNILMKKVKEHGAKVFLVSTGWNGRHQRISLKSTRKIINSILDDSILTSETTTLPIFNLTMPTTLKDLTTDTLDPRSSYNNPKEWEEGAKTLANLFIENFKQFGNTPNSAKIIASGPKIQ